MQRQCGLLNLELGDVPVGSGLESDLIAYQNMALQEILDFGEWDWLMARGVVTTTSGQVEVDLPADFESFRPNDLPYFEAGLGPLCFADAGELARMRTYSASASGQPWLWNVAYDAARDRRQMTFYPTPGDAYDVVVPYRRLVSDLTTRSQTPAIPNGMHWTLCLGALAYTEEYGERSDPGGRRAVFVAALRGAWQRNGSTVKGQEAGPLASFDARHDAQDRPRNDSIVVQVIPSSP